MKENKPETYKYIAEFSVIVMTGMCWIIVWQQLIEFLNK